MKIKKLQAKNFMVFHDVDMDFSPNINVICGENSTGKTVLLKLMYSTLKSISSVYDSKKGYSKENLEDALVQKLQGVFRPDENAIGRLSNRVQGTSKTDVLLEFDTGNSINTKFSSRSANHVDLNLNGSSFENTCKPVYLPPKEIISATENFGSLYSDYHIAFEETYYDLTRLLEKPLKKGKNTQEQNQVLTSFEKIVHGDIVQKDKKFYLRVSGAGEFEMGLVSEGYRKISTIMYLILSGSLDKGSVLFWDEPETNMNPKMIKPMVDAIIVLAKMGVQVFITTHDYFVQQSFNLCAEYSNDKRPLKYKFISLYRDDQEVVQYESVDHLSDLQHNSIMEEFDALYDREQEYIYAK